MEEKSGEEGRALCPKCGRPLSVDAEVCPVCGTPRAPQSGLVRVGRNLVFVAGFICFFSWFLNFGSALAVSLANALMALRFLVIGFLSVVGWSCGWTAGTSRWRKGKLRWTRAQIGFITFLGLANLVDSTAFLGSSNIGFVVLLGTGASMTALSLVGLVLTASV